MHVVQQGENGTPTTRTSTLASQAEFDTLVPDYRRVGRTERGVCTVPQRKRATKDQALTASVALDSRLCHTLVADALKQMDVELLEVRSVRFLSSHPWASGKRLRPMTFLLSNLALRLDRGRATNVNGRESRLASAIELFHEASLVHDDLVDRAQMRRGTPTIQMSGGEGLALLVGDYLIFRGLKLVLDAAQTTDDIRLAREMADTGLSIARGEAEQLDRYLSRFESPDRATMPAYIDLIAKKTAGFFAGCAEAGAAMGGADAATRVIFREFGMHMGIAFQMVDDVLDVAGDLEAAQKTLRSNVDEGTITLPMIHALALHSGNRELKALVAGRTLSAKARQRVARLLARADVLRACDTTIEQYVAKAKGWLAKAPLNIYRLGLEDLLDYVQMCPWGNIFPLAREGRPHSADGASRDRSSKSAGHS